MAMGRPPEVGVSRAEVICVRFTAEEVAAIDESRGLTSRSAYIRATLAAETRVGARP